MTRGLTVAVLGSFAAPKTHRRWISDRATSALTLCAIVLISSGLLGCGSERGVHGFNFKNQTDVRVIIVRALPDGTEIVEVTALDAGLTYFDRGFPGLTATGDICQEMTLVARDAEHAEVARLSGRLCRDQEWIIRRPSPTGVTRLSDWPVTADSK